MNVILQIRCNSNCECASQIFLSVVLFMCSSKFVDEMWAGLGLDCSVMHSLMKLMNSLPAAANVHVYIH